jgi:hypothetical protein
VRPRKAHREGDRREARRLAEVEARGGQRGPGDRAAGGRAVDTAAELSADEAEASDVSDAATVDGESR